MDIFQIFLSESEEMQFQYLATCHINIELKGQFYPQTTDKEKDMEGNFIQKVKLMFEFQS